MSQPIIRVEGLKVGWDTTVLMQDVSFEVQRGEVFVILGGSGCGKSTLLRHLVGLETPQAGTVHVDVAQHGPIRGKPSYGVMFQSGALLGSLTVGENVSLALEEWTSHDPDAVHAMMQAKLRLVGLEGTEDKLPSELSGGMKKRAAIARAMILEPELLFFDEPSAGLDPISAAELDDLILRLSKTLKTTIVIVTHDLDSIMRVGSRCIMLERTAKGIIAEGVPSVLKRESKDPRVLAFFNRQPLEGA